MNEDLIKRSDAIKAIDDNFSNIPIEQTTEILKVRRAIRELPSADIPKKVVAQITFDEEKLREIVKEAVERFKEEYEITDRPQEWIPCSERLPKSYVEVLVCDDFGWINLGAYRPCDVSEDCSGWSLHSHTKIGTEEVIAWMPLPKPWKGTDDEAD